MPSVSAGQQADDIEATRWRLWRREVWLLADCWQDWTEPSASSSRVGPPSTSCALLSSDNCWSWVARPVTLHPLWQAFCSEGQRADGHNTNAGEGHAQARRSWDGRSLDGAPWRAGWRSRRAGHQSQDRQSHSLTQPHPHSRHSRHSVKCGVSERAPERRRHGPRSLRGWVALGTGSPGTAAC
jgi:hypothetical protein